MAKPVDQEADLNTTIIDRWKYADEKARNALCTFQVANPKHHEGYGASSRGGSGHIVDKSRGIVVTNSHIIGGTASLGYVVINQVSQYRMKSIYNDPEHDFALVALLTADGSTPEDLPAEILLDPNRALPNTEIHRVSDESGLGGNIGQSYIGRIDCNPPALPSSQRNDMNTEYISLSMLSRGGSSGSLAVDREGFGVALTCSADQTNSYLLAVGVVSRALQKIQRNERITRGTLQIKWELTTLYKCKQRGLSKEWSDRFEALKVTKLVSASIVLPGGPADGLLEAGHILLELDGELVTSMFQVGIYMDEHVHKSVKLTCWGPQGVVEAECTVEDLHSLTPTHILIRGGTAFHRLSLSIAMRCNKPAKGIFVAIHAQKPFRAMMLLESINDIQITDMEQLATLLDKLYGDDGKVVVKVTQKTMDRQWVSIPQSGYLLRATDQVSCELRRQPPEGGRWEIAAISPPASVASPFVEARQQRSTAGVEKDDFIDSLSHLRLSDPDPDVPEEVENVFATFICHESFRDINIDGALNDSGGCGVIVEQGLAVVFRNALSELDEIAVTVAARQRVRARVIFQHPAHNFGLVRFDTASVDQKLLRKCPLAVAICPAGSEVFYVPFNTFNRTATKTKIVNVDEEDGAKKVVASMFFNFRHMTCRLKDEPVPDADENGGVLLNVQGHLVALVGCTADHYYLPVNELRAIIEPVLGGWLPDIRFRDFDVSCASLSRANEIGLSEKWVSRIANTHLLKIILVPSHIGEERHPLHHGDLILEVNGKVVTRVPQLGFQYSATTLRMLVLRDDKELEIDVPLVSAEDANVNEVLSFCGAAVQKPCLSARMNFSHLHSEIYVAATKRGSQAEMYGLPPGVFITQVNGNKVRTLDAFWQLVRHIPYEQDIRLQVVNAISGFPSTVTLRKNILSPTLHLHMNPTGRLETVMGDEPAWRASLRDHAGIGEPQGLGYTY